MREKVKRLFAFFLQNAKFPPDSLSSPGNKTGTNPFLTGQILVLNGGHIVQKGTHEELFPAVRPIYGFPPCS